MYESVKEPRIALLIDADNAPARKIDAILTELSTLGVINIRRAYGNWTKEGLAGWQDMLLEHAIRPMQQFDYSKRKNATDMAMTVDAMELLYTDRPDAFGIVSSDADFTPLVMHLRSKGAAVYGFGAAQTPKPFVNACSRFLYLEAMALDEESSGDELVAAMLAKAHDRADSVSVTPSPLNPAVALAVPTTQLRQDTRLMNLLRDAVKAVQGEDGWARVASVGTQIGNRASFDPRNFGYATLSKLIAATQAFDVREEGTPRIAVRDKRKSVAVTAGGAASPIVVHAAELIADHGRKPQVVIARTGVHDLRKALVALAVRRVSVQDLLVAIPELSAGQPVGMTAIGSRLRQLGLLRSCDSPRRLFEQHPMAFRLQLPNAQPQWVQHLTG